MDDVNEVDFNDLMFEINEPHQQHELASVGNDSNLGSSISNFGIDRDNPQENLRYIQQNQDQRAIIQGIGVAAECSDGNSEAIDSGLATSVSKTRSSEFIPEIIEYQIKASTKSKTTSELNEIETLPETSNDETIPKYEESESEKLAENLQELHISPFDLAIERGYYDQAQIYYDDTTSRGSQPKTKHVKRMKIEDIRAEIEGDYSDLESEEDFWDKEFILQQIFMLKKDFNEYLENIERNEHKKVLKRLNYKKRLCEPEKQIKKNIKTKENRKRLKEETIKIINKKIDYLKDLEIKFNQVLQQMKEEHAERNDIPEGCEIFPNSNEASKPYEENKNRNEEFDKDGAAGSSQSSDVASA